MRKRIFEIIIIFLILLLDSMYCKADESTDIIKYQLLKEHFEDYNITNTIEIKDFINKIKMILDDEYSKWTENKILLTENNIDIFRFLSFGAVGFYVRYYAIDNKNNYYSIDEPVDFINTISNELVLPDSLKLQFFIKIYDKIMCDNSDVIFYTDYDEEIFGPYLTYELFNSIYKNDKNELCMMKLYQIKYDNTEDRYQISYFLNDQGKFRVKKILVKRN